MATVLLLPYHGFGHYNAFFAIAKNLLERGDVVLFAGADFFSAYVTKQGYDFAGFRSVPFASNFENWSNRIKGSKWLYLGELIDRITDSLYAERHKEITTLIKTIRPAIVLLDASQATDFIVMYPLLKQMDIRFALVHTMLPTDLAHGRPPFTTFLTPGSPGIEAAISIEKRKRNRKLLLQSLKYFGLNDRQLVKRRLKRNGVPLSYDASIPSLLPWSVATVTEVVLAPVEFDFSPIDRHRHYVGFPPATQKARSDDTDFLQFLAHLPLLGKNRKIVYCCFGTIRSPKILDRWIPFLIEASSDEELVWVITGMRWTSPPRNVFFFDSVFQAEFLFMCDAFITHGGLNSIREAIFATTPMLVCDVHDSLDRRGNGARVAYHGLGLLFESRKEDKAAFIVKLNQLLGDNKFKKNIERFREINSAYTQQRFFSILSSLQTLS
jgi:zeaxanthin glucosyltransferase